MIARLRRWLRGGSPAQPGEPPEGDAAERLEAARRRLKETIEPVDSEGADE